MSRKNILLLIAAAFIAIGVAFAMKSRGGNAPQVAATPEKAVERILVAKKDIPAGNFVKSSDELEWTPWPTGAQTYHIKEGSEDIMGFEGAVARRAMKAGEPVTANTLIKPGAGGFLSAVLEPGKRAVSIAVSATSGTSGFVFPGDRVDLIVTHRLKVRQTSDAEPEESVVAESFIENVRVVAVDQMLDNPDNKAILAKTITVEVTPEQAKRISVAEELGKISLTLRSLSSTAATDQAAATGEPDSGEDYVSTITRNEGGPEEPISNYTRDSDVSRVLDKHSDAKPRILVIRGNQNETREFYQDGGQ